jgi:hypothetical protein
MVWLKTLSVTTSVLVLATLFVVSCAAPIERPTQLPTPTPTPTPALTPSVTGQPFADPVKIDSGLIAGTIRSKEEIVSKFGRLRVLDDRELVIEMDDTANFEELKNSMAEAFGDQVDVELIRKG